MQIRLSRLTKTLLLFTCFLFQSCFFQGNKIEFNPPKAQAGSDKNSHPPVGLSAVSINNDQLVLMGVNLQYVQDVRVESQQGQIEDFEIETQTSGQLIANGLRNINFKISDAFSLILNDAYGASTYQIAFELDDGSVTAAKLSQMGAQTGQVLKWDGMAWSPSDLSGLEYMGNWDAQNNIPDLNAMAPLGGQFYIVNQSGTTSLFGGTGTNSWNVGDWAIWNEDAGQWEKVVSNSEIVSFNGRTGAVNPQSGDYTWGMIDKSTSSLNDLSDVDTTGASSGMVLSWDGVSWVPEVDSGGEFNVSAPLLKSSATTPVVSLPMASGTQDGYLSQTDWSTFNNKIGTAGGSFVGPINMGGNSISNVSNIDGVDLSALDTNVSNNTTSLNNLTTDDVTEGTQLYFTDALAQQAAVVNSSAGNETNQAPSVSAIKSYIDSEILGATASSGDFLADGSIPMAGNLNLDLNSIDNINHANLNQLNLKDNNTPARYVSFVAPASVSTSYTLTLPGSVGSNGQVLVTDATGALSWQTLSSGLNSFSVSPPLVDIGTATDPSITLPAAGTSSDGFLTQADWNIFNDKEDALPTGGSTQQYFRGDKTLADFDSEVRSAPLTGFTAGSGTVAATDTVLQAIEKLAGSTGGSSLADTDDLNEGATNLYFTTARAQNAAVVNSTTGSETVQAASVQAMKNYVTTAISATGNLDSLTVTAPLSDTGTATDPIIGLAPADASTDGYLSQTDWNTFNNKEDALPTGGSAQQYFKGDKTLGDLGSEVRSTPLTGFTTSSGTVTATDTVLQAIEKLAGSTGGSSLADTDDLNEGATNLYFTAARAQNAAVVNSTTGSETVQAASVQAMKSYVSTAISASGGLDSLTVSAPLSDTGTATDPIIGLAPADASTDGYITQADWTTFNNKEDALPTGGTAQQYFKGDKTLGDLGSEVRSTPLTGFTAGSGTVAATDTVLQAIQKLAGSSGGSSLTDTDDLTEGVTNLYFTDQRAKNAAVVDGVLGGELDVAPSVNSIKTYVDNEIASATSSTQISGDLNMSGNNIVEAGNMDLVTLQFIDDDATLNYLTLKAPLTMPADVTFTLPGATGSDGDVLTSDGTGVMEWRTPASSVETLGVSAPIGNSGTATNPNITISPADASTDGYITQADWTTFNNKEDALPTGGTAQQYFKGDKTLGDLGSEVRSTPLTGFTAGSGTVAATDTVLQAIQKLAGSSGGSSLTDTDDLTEGVTNLYFTDQRAKSAAVVDGIFGGELDMAPSVNSIKTYVDNEIASATSSTQISGDLNMSGNNIVEAGNMDLVTLQFIDDDATLNYLTLKAPLTMPADVTFTLPGATGSDGDVLTSDGTGVMEWRAPASSVETLGVSAPIGNSGTATNPNITITQAGAASSGYLSQTDWNTFNDKEDALPTGGSAQQYLRGDKTLGSFETEVRGSPLTGFSAASGTVAATDTILQAMNKIVGNIDDLAAASGDDLGNHTATQDLDLGTSKLVGEGGTDGVYVDATGNVGVGTSTPTKKLDVNGDIKSSGSVTTGTGQAFQIKYGSTSCTPNVAAQSGQILCTVSFGHTFNSAPNVTLTLTNPGGFRDALILSVDSKTTTGFDIYVFNSSTANTVDTSMSIDWTAIGN